MLKKYFDNDLIGRWGGDEFLVCTNKSKREIIKIVENINKSLLFLQKRFDHDTKKILSVSIGACDNEKLPFEKRFTNADLALYKIKKSTKGNIAFYADLDYVKIEKDDLNQL
jgi:diguanylate cyclase (GGDEF)-like protein